MNIAKLKNIFLSWPVLPWLILAAAFVLRVWGIDWALPLKYAHIDESVVIFYAFKFFSGDFNPHVFFDYPTFFLYIIFFIWSIYYAIGTVLGFFVSLNQFVGKYFSGNLTDIYLLARMVSVLFSTATVYLVYKTTKILYSEKVSILASIFMCFAGLHILHSHYATADTTALFFTLLSVYFAVKYYVSEKTKHLFISCFVLGLAAATKYYPLIFGLGLLLIPVLKQHKLSKQIVNIYLLGFGLIILGFFIACPYAFLDFTAFSSRFNTIFTNVIMPHEFSLFNKSALVWQHLISGLGPVLIIIFLTSLLFFFKTRTEFFLFTVFLIFFAFVMTWKTVASYYLFPLYPFISIISAKGLENISEKYNKNIFVVATLIFVLTVLPKIVFTNYVLTQKDTRIIAHEWVIKNVPVKSKILRFPYTAEFYPNENYAVKVDWNYTVPVKEYIQYEYIITTEKIVPPEPEFVLIKSFFGPNISSGFHNPKVNIYKKK